MNNATETEWFQKLLPQAHTLVFPSKRIRFWNSEGSAGSPLQGQAVFFIGGNVAGATVAFNRFGFVCPLAAARVLERAS